MSDPGEPEAIDEEYDLDAPPQQVWRAISLPEFRELWLPGGTLSGPDPVVDEPERSVSYRMREADPPHLESTVTFEIASNGSGGTRLRIRHRLVDGSAGRERLPANGGHVLMRAA